MSHYCNLEKKVFYYAALQGLPNFEIGLHEKYATQKRKRKNIYEITRTRAFIRILVIKKIAALYCITTIFVIVRNS